MKVKVKMYQSYPKKFSGKKTRGIIIATGEYDTETKKIVVQKGSKLNPFFVAVDTKIIADRKNLEDNGVIVGGEFVKDFEFRALSTASTLILGRGDRGTYTWKEDVSGKDIIIGGVMYLLEKNPDIKDENELAERLKASDKQKLHEDFYEAVRFSKKDSDEKTDDIDDIIEEDDNDEETATATEEKTELPDQKISDELKPYVGKNVIFYGVPGCGKSRFIKELLNGIDKCYYKRILFHPEYSYGDFIGQIIPTLDKDNKPTYEFKEGPMLQMLKLANDNENKEFFLIIEEINRGNAPALFGDFFQLLDRNGGKSEYSINNAEIEKKLNKKEIEIPKNLTILATMNTCDQNVFTLDTAFKRRFRMTRIKNSFDKVELVIKGKGFEIEWRKLGPAINTAIVEKCNDGVSSEDKQLGAYFVHGEEIDIREFAEKVLMYLWDDVVKYDKQQLFKSTYKTLDSLIDAFCEGKNVFADSCADIKSIYDKIEEEKAKKAEGVSEIKSEEEKETPEE